MPLLRLESIYKNFGGLQALSDVNMDIEESSITALIGPNGSGKTTLFNAIRILSPLPQGKSSLMEKTLAICPHISFRAGGSFEPFSSFLCSVQPLFGRMWQVEHLRKVKRRYCPFFLGHHGCVLRRSLFENEAWTPFGIWGLNILPMHKQACSIRAAASRRVGASAHG